MDRSPVGERIETILYSLAWKVIQKENGSLQSGHNMDVMPPSSWSEDREGSRYLQIFRLLLVHLLSCSWRSNGGPDLVCQLSKAITESAAIVKLKRHKVPLGCREQAISYKSYMPNDVHIQGQSIRTSCQKVGDSIQENGAIYRSGYYLQDFHCLHCLGDTKGSWSIWPRELKKEPLLCERGQYFFQSRLEDDNLRLFG